MDANLTTAIVTACSTALVAIVAIVTNSKQFGNIHMRITDMNSRMDRIEARMDRIETKLDHIEQLLVGYMVDVARIKEKLGIT